MAKTEIDKNGIRYHQDTNKPLTGTVMWLHKNGQLRNKANYKDGKLEGLNETFYENGQLWYRTNYKDGKQEGLGERFHENDQLKEKQNWKDGKKDGLEESFWENGWVRATRNYKDGKLIKSISNRLIPKRLKDGKLIE